MSALVGRRAEGESIERVLVGARAGRSGVLVVRVQLAEPVLEDRDHPVHLRDQQHGAPLRWSAAGRLAVAHAERAASRSAARFIRRARLTTTSGRAPIR